MLVLSRKDQESICIGDVTVTVVKIGSNYVRLGITAPKDINIRRTELEPHADNVTVSDEDTK